MPNLQFSWNPLQIWVPAFCMHKNSFIATVLWNDCSYFVGIPNLHQKSLQKCFKYVKMVNKQTNTTRFLEALLVRETDGKLKKKIKHTTLWLKVYGWNGVENVVVTKTRCRIHQITPFQQYRLGHLNCCHETSFNVGRRHLVSCCPRDRMLSPS